MATLTTLVLRGDLMALAGGLDDDEQPYRLLYTFPHVTEWLVKTLPVVAAFDPNTDLTPNEQVDALVHDFVSGDDFSYYEICHFMHPDHSGVWELKTTDTRMFGWFHARGVFVAANVDSMERIKMHGLYAGYRDDTVRRRDALDLDEPKFVVGGYTDVL